MLVLGIGEMSGDASTGGDLLLHKNVVSPNELDKHGIIQFFRGRRAMRYRGAVVVDEKNFAGGSTIEGKFRWVLRV